MPVWNGSDQAMANFCSTIAPRHVLLHRGFIDENKLRWGQLPLLLPPFGACLGNVLTSLLGGVEGLFLKLRSSAASVLFISPVLAEILCVASSHERNSAIVASGRLLTCSMIAECRPLSLGTTWQHCGRAVVCPVNLRRDRTFDT
jgi:hypothetical protein